MQDTWLLCWRRSKGKEKQSNEGQQEEAWRTDGQVEVEEDGWDEHTMLRDVGKVDEPGEHLTVSDELRSFPVLLQVLLDFFSLTAPA